MLNPRMMQTQQMVKPKKPLSIDMQSDAAELAAQKFQQPQQQPKPAAAPVVPTTNMRMPPKPMTPMVQSMGPQTIAKTPPPPVPQMLQPQAPKAQAAPQVPAPQAPPPAPPPPRQPDMQMMRAPAPQNLQPIQGQLAQRAPNAARDMQINPAIQQAIRQFEPNVPSTDVGAVSYDNEVDVSPSPVGDVLEEAPGRAPPPRDGEIRAPDGSKDPLMDMAQRRLEQLIGQGARDTTEQEKLIREQMQRDVGAGQASMNARLAAGGGGTSGALGALSTDMRSRAALDAANAIQGVQQDSRDEYLNRVKTGIGGYFNERGADTEDTKTKMILDYLAALRGDLDGKTEAPPLGQSIPDGHDPLVPAKTAEQHGVADLGLPKDATQLSDGSWRDPDGNIWVVDRNGKAVNNGKPTVQEKNWWEFWR